MYYLLYEASAEYVNDESLVLFQTDAYEELALKFIEYYFERYEVIGVFPNYNSINNKVIDLVKVNEDDIHHKFNRQGLKNQTEQEQLTKRHLYLLPWTRKEEELKERLKTTEEEMHRTIFRHFDPSEVTDELVRKMNEIGYEKNRIKNGKVRFRLTNHEQVRKEFEEKMRYIRTEIQNAKVEWSIAYDEFEESNPMESFDDVTVYERRSF